MWQACFLPAMELHIYKRDYMKWKNVQWYFPLSLVNVYIFWICKVYLNCKKVKTNPKKTCWIWKQTWWDCLTSTAWVLQVHVGPMRSTSVGWLKLKSSDPNDHPIIEPNYLSTGDCSLSLLSCQLFSCLFQQLISVPTHHQFRSAGWYIVTYFSFIKVN